MKLTTQLKTGLLAAALTLGAARTASAAEEDIKLEDCPAVVQKTIADNAGGGRIEEVERETKKDGSVVYEAEVKRADGTEVEITVAADGTLLQVEEDD